MFFSCDAKVENYELTIIYITQGKQEFESEKMFLG